jgi:hypothetical protein
LLFKKVADRISSNIDLLRRFPPAAIEGMLFRYFRYSVVCTKHPGFREEREWRVVYSPEMEKSERIVPEIYAIDGIPQIVQKIPLKSVPEEGLVGLNVNELLDQVIIGPTTSPFAIAEAICCKLRDQGIPVPWGLVRLSSIPLRR